MKILIADDEAIELRSLGLLIENSLPDINIEYANNGIELVKLSQTFLPDIALVDIDMPGINGLESIDILTKMGIKTEFIICTALRKFEYAKKSINLNVYDYILKPIRKKVLIEKLENCIKKIESDEAAENANLKQKKMLEKFIPIIESDIITSMILGNINKNHFEDYTKEVGFERNKLYVMTFEIVHSNMDDLNSIEINELKERIVKEISYEAKQINSCIVDSIYNNKLSIIIGSNQEEYHECKERAMSVAQLLREKLESKFSFKVFAGVGDICTEVERIVKSYKESQLALSECDLLTPQYHFDDLKLEILPIIDWQEQIPGFINYLIGGERAKTKNITESFFTDEELDKIDDNKLSDVLVSSLTEIKWTLSINGYNLRQKDYDIKTLMTEFGSMEGRKQVDLFISYISRIINELQKNKSKRKTDFINQAVEIIEAEYMNDISLTYLAEQVNVSTYHLSHLFTQQVGKSFKSYLKHLRLTKAIELIKTTEFQTKEVAYKVGYNDPSYFSKLFKEYTGFTVGEFKEKGNKF